MSARTTPDPSGEEQRFTLPEAHRHFAVALNGEVWELLARPERTSEEDAAMLRAAHACLYHWLQAGTAVHAQRGEWLLAHVYTVLGNAPAALAHAAACMALTEGHPGEMADFDVAYAYAGLARAHALAGNHVEAQRYYSLAAERGHAIVNDEDRAIFLGDFESGDWYGLARA